MAKEEPKVAKGGGQPEAPKPAQSKLNLILLVLVVVLLGAAGFFGWNYFKLHKGGAPTLASADSKSEPQQAENGKAAEKGKAKSSADEGATVNFEPFLVNLADKDSSRYLKASIRILVKNKEMAAKVSAGDVLVPRMRDTILSILSTKVANDVTSNEGKQKLKQEIIDRVNEFLPEQAATDVFFTDFVVQL